MSEEQFASTSVIVLCTGLMLYMFFIIYKLAKESKAGKKGFLILLFVLGFGMFGFIAKTILTEVLQ
ncbi:DUF2788 domain-containing protein [Chitinilyticum litopenaei]|uniref:DUF2788 domain-containing protein n=1 Tax=Chitinilyticum litopenaei TaxID=1121276 RepID=UPI000410226A|nr:DUF2788 domain-containing protein [Chitinilyticum litopenaei]